MSGLDLLLIFAGWTSKTFAMRKSCLPLITLLGISYETSIFSHFSRNEKAAFCSWPTASHLLPSSLLLELRASYA